MLFSYDWLKDYIKGKMPAPKKLAEILTMHSFEVSDVKKSGKDYILDIDVLPNRAADCFSHLGIDREIAAITGLNYRDSISIIKENKNLKARDFISVEVRDKMACPRYTARVMTDVKVDSSPKWMRDRLKICGLRPINNIVDTVNYVMLETGQPLHAFDLAKLASVNPKSQIPRPTSPASELAGGRANPKQIPNPKSQTKKIIVRFAKKGEKITTLDNEKYNLDEDILVIADEKEPLAIAGIKGGKSAEISKKTKTVILESANFNRLIIRRASQKLALKTDASLRFDQGIDPNLTELAINRAAYLIQKIAKGKIVREIIDFYPKKVLPKRIKLDLNYLERLLGIKIPQKEIKNILKKLNFQLFDIGSRTITVEVPTFRLDISIPEDLIEEIGRIYGYEKIPATFPIAVLVPPKRNLEIFWEDMAKNILKEVGFSEVYNYSFISEKDAKIFANKNLIEVENPISVEYKYLRPSLTPNLLKNVAKNQRNFQEIRIFELGKIFRLQPDHHPPTSTIIEKRMLTGLMTGESFYQLKGVLDLLFNKLGISQLWYDEYLPTPEESRLAIWGKGKSAEIKVNQTELGFLGEISSKILEEFKIEKKVFVFDLDFEKLSKLASEEQEYLPISRYPAAVRDLAVLVPREVRVEEVLNVIEISGGTLVRDVDLFDIYEGEEIPKGKKNLAFRIVYQSETKTLSSEEINEIQNRIIKALEENSEWEVRK